LIIVTEGMRKIEGITAMKLKWNVTIRIIRINEYRIKEA
jgi:hypothetical protein